MPHAPHRHRREKFLIIKNINPIFTNKIKNARIKAPYDKLPKQDGWKEAITK